MLCSQTYYGIGMGDAAAAAAPLSFAVIWDVDGTLSDSFQLGFSSTNHVLARHGVGPINEADYHAGTKLTTPRRLAWHVTGDPDDPVGQALGAEFDGLYVQLVSPATAPLYAGARELLLSLTSDFRCRLGAVSNACGAYVAAVLRANNIAHLFSSSTGAVLGADDVPAAKPAPDGLMQCAASLGVPPHRCVYVGDSPSDGAAATAAGMASIGVTWGSHAAEAVAPAFSATVDSVGELERELRRFIHVVACNAVQA